MPPASVLQIIKLLFSLNRAYWWTNFQIVVNAVNIVAFRIMAHIYNIFSFDIRIACLLNMGRVSRIIMKKTTYRL